MSTAFAISAVTAVLQHFLTNALADVGPLFGGAVKLSAVAPDLVQQSFGSGGTGQNQVNIFLHQVTYNQGWRNTDLPSLGADGRTPLANPPLALDLHYLLTAYGSEDWQAETLLGHALLMLHQFPVIARKDISLALGALPAAAFAVQLNASGIADQIEQVKLTPSPLNREEMAWLWTALKADYRPTFPFQASVVLIEPQLPLNLPLPVLSRNIAATAIQPAILLKAVPPDKQVSAASGDTVTVSGEFLKNAAEVVLTYPRLGIRAVAPAINVTANTLQFVVPADSIPNPCPAGVYSLALDIADSAGNVTQTTNALPFAVAPVLQIAPLPVVQSATQTQVTATFSPAARPNQKVSLTIGSQSAVAPVFETDQTTLTFIFTPPLASGKQLARLVVDGSPSQVMVKWSAAPGGTPTFDQSFWVTI
jgi:Pvc16 N-terminal domain